VIEYADEDIGPTYLRIGPGLDRMTDDEVLRVFNETIEAMNQSRRDYKHVAIEVPVGQPQIEWSDRVDQWCARGEVLRFIIHDGGGEDGREPLIEIDDKQLSWAEFGRMLTTFSGWGMRLVVVPDDRIHDRPTIRVRNPDKGKR